MKVRRATHADAGDIESMWMRFLAEQAEHEPLVRPSADALARWQADYPVWLHDTTRCLAVVADDEHLVGFASGLLWSMPPIFEEVPEVFIEYLFVEPDRRRAGAARAMVEFLRDWGIELGARRIRLTAVVASTEAAAFWDALGARIVSADRVIDLEDNPRAPTRSSRMGFAGNR